MVHDASYSTVQSILLTEWDPIGVRDERVAQNEYDAYARRVHSMLSNGATAREIARYLTQVETEMMGLVPVHDRAMRVSEMLLRVAR